MHIAICPLQYIMPYASPNILLMPTALNVMPNVIIATLVGLNAYTTTYTL